MDTDDVSPGSLTELSALSIFTGPYVVGKPKNQNVRGFERGTESKPRRRKHYTNIMGYPLRTCAQWSSGRAPPGVRGSVVGGASTASSCCSLSLIALLRFEDSSWLSLWVVCVCVRVCVRDERKGKCGVPEAVVGENRGSGNQSARGGRGRRCGGLCRDEPPGLWNLGFGSGCWNRAIIDESVKSWHGWGHRRWAPDRRISYVTGRIVVGLLAQRKRL